MKKCLITIRRRKDPVEVDEERGRKIKVLRFGDVNGNNKAEPDMDIDLGDDWSGKLDQIVSIEFVRADVERTMSDPNIEAKQEEQRLLSLSPEERANNLGMFSISWFMRSGMKQKEVPAKALAEAKKLAVAYFKKYPSVAVLPITVLEPILEKQFGNTKPQTLAQSKRIPLSTGKVLAE